jgi:hypothetical protein
LVVAPDTALANVASVALISVRGRPVRIFM